MWKIKKKKDLIKEIADLTKANKDKDIEIEILQRIRRYNLHYRTYYWHLEPLEFFEIVRDTAISEEDYIDYRITLEHMTYPVGVVNQEMIQEWTEEYNKWVKLR